MTDETSGEWLESARSSGLPADQDAFPDLTPQAGYLADPGNSAGLPPSDGPAAVRASDAEREQVVKVLSTACADGRLTLEELGARVGSAYGAITRAELVPLTSDLPVTAEVTHTGAALAAVEPARTKRKWLVSVMSEHKQTGHWRLPSRSVGVTVMGEQSIDLRNALIESSDISMTLYLMMGEQTVIVPQGVEVEVSGFVFMGEKNVNVSSARPRPGVPRLHIRVVGMMGQVNIKTA